MNSVQERIYIDKMLTFCFEFCPKCIRFEKKILGSSCTRPGPNAIGYYISIPMIFFEKKFFPSLSKNDIREGLCHHFINKNSNEAIPYMQPDTVFRCPVCKSISETKKEALKCRNTHFKKD